MDNGFEALKNHTLGCLDSMAEKIRSGEFLMIETEETAVTQPAILSDDWLEHEVTGEKTLRLRYIDSEAYMAHAARMEKNIVEALGGRRV